MKKTKKNLVLMKNFLTTKAKNVFDFMAPKFRIMVELIESDHVKLVKLWFAQFGTTKEKFKFGISRPLCELSTLWKDEAKLKF